MTVPRKITIHKTQEESLILISSEAWVQYINLDREVLTPSPCEKHMDTDINSHADEAVMESYANILFILDVRFMDVPAGSHGRKVKPDFSTFLLRCLP